MDDWKKAAEKEHARAERLLSKCAALEGENRKLRDRLQALIDDMSDCGLHEPALNKGPRWYRMSTPISAGEDDE